MLIEQLKRIFRKPTPLERAAKELGQIEHSMLDASEWMEFLQALLDLIFVLGLFLTVTIVMLVWGIYVH